MRVRVLNTPRKSFLFRESNRGFVLYTLLCYCPSIIIENKEKESVWTTGKYTGNLRMSDLLMEVLYFDVFNESMLYKYYYI